MRVEQGGMYTMSGVGIRDGEHVIVPQEKESKAKTKTK